MANNSSIDCSNLSSRTNFASYIASISNATGGDFSLVNECRASVCGALWGSGNPDISGIGMTIGYVLETIIGTAIVAVFFGLGWRPASDKSLWIRLVMASAAEIFYDTAIFFAFGIQIASVVALSRANFGINANGMGAITLKITWAISLLTLLPLLPFSYGNLIFRKGEESKILETATSDTPSIGLKDKETRRSVGRRNLRLGTKREEEARDRQRFFLFVLCWMISIYPFLSRMVGTFGQSQIGNGSGKVISTIDWSKIEDTCYAGINPLLPSQETAMTAFGIGSWLFISVIVIYKVTLLAIQRQYPESRFGRRLEKKTVFLNSNGVLERRLWTTSCVIVPLLSVSQMWTFVRLQKLQIQMTNAAGGVYLDEQWTFGQIIAVIVFMPVFIQVWFLLRNAKIYHPNFS